MVISPRNNPRVEGKRSWRLPPLAASYSGSRLNDASVIGVSSFSKYHIGDMDFVSSCHSDTTTVNSEVVLKFFYMDGSGEKAPEVISGIVRWCRTRGFGFAAGIEFKGLDPDQHPRLIAFLEQTEPFREKIHDTKGYDQPGRDSH